MWPQNTPGEAVSGDDLVDEAVALVVETWLAAAEADETPAERALARQMGRLIEDDDAIRFTMPVHRSRHPPARRPTGGSSAGCTRASDQGAPEFLGGLDRFLLRVGAVVAPLLPWMVMPLVRRRMRGLVGHLVVDAEPEPMDRHFATRRSEGYSLNVNLLGEAVLGEAEAGRRRARTLDLIDRRRRHPCLGQGLGDRQPDRPVGVRRGSSNGSSTASASSSAAPRRLTLRRS